MCCAVNKSREHKDLLLPCQRRVQMETRAQSEHLATKDL